jgi:hypothetical protein
LVLIGRGSKEQTLEEFHDLYSSSNITRVIKIRRSEIGGACGTYE